MILNLIVYGMTVSLLLALAGWAFERAVRYFAFPTRWIWGGAMAGSVGYLLVAVLRPRTVSAPLETASATPLDVLLAPLIVTITGFVDPTPAGVGLDTILGVGWVVLTLFVVAVLGRAHLKLRSDRSTWTPSELDGRDVLVSEDLGPGVVGWIRSVIVMPRWAFRMPAQERELMLQHEGEHCHAGDMRLAGIAILLLAALPWNVALWWQIHRLRLAIEIDCDRRVLRRSMDVKRYATLLVEIGARGTATKLSALAFARPIPSIERRILAMTDKGDPRYMRTVGLALLAALLVVASCQVEQLSINVDVDQPEEPTVPASARSVQVDRQTTDRQRQADRDEVERAREERIRELQREVDALDAVAAARADAVEVLEAQIGALKAETLALLREALEAREALEGEARPDESAAIETGPVFTPMTVRPELKNRNEVIQALMREYPQVLRDAGIGGQVVVWFFISNAGQVLDRRISQTSGHEQLDAAALRVADVYDFTPAMNRDEAVQVWIQLPITFQVQN